MKLVPPNNQQEAFLQEANNEDVNTKDEDVERIREWLKKEPHLPDFDDYHSILTFLRMCKFSLEQTKKKMETYFTARGVLPEFFVNRDITRPELQRVPHVISFAIMPHLTPEGRRITVVGDFLSDFEVQDTINFAKIIFMIGDLRINTEHGVHDIYILNAGVCQIKNLPKLNVSLVKKFLICALEAYPVRIKEVHVVNVTPVINVVIKWISRFIKEKLIKRIKIHQNLESLHECISKDLLPEEYGGTAGKLQDFTKQWMMTLEEHGEWFKEQEKLKADETKRIDNCAFSDTLFGMDGSFRSLTID